MGRCGDPTRCIDDPVQVTAESAGNTDCLDIAKGYFLSESIYKNSGLHLLAGLAILGKTV